MPTDDTVDYSSIRFPSRQVIRDVDQLCEGMSKLPEVLGKMGFDSLRKGQDSAVMEIMAGRDTLCVLPTSLGKSAVYIVPTLALGWRTLVFSPLVALMRDQVQKLHKWGIAGDQMSGLQSDGQNQMAARRWARGELNFLYIAPERLRNPEFRAALDVMPPDMVTVDEAHCFPGDTAVLTEFGISTLNYLRAEFENGQHLPRVWSRSSDGHAELQTIRNVWKNPTAPLQFLRVRGVGTVEVTAAHIIPTTKGDKQVQDLRAGDKVFTRPVGALYTSQESAGYRALLIVEDVRPSPRVVEVLYDLEVDANHNYFVHVPSSDSALLVHNCISGWSDNFRPDYASIGDLIRERKPKVVSAFTATCTTEVETDIRRILCMGDAAKVTYMPRRTNLKLRSQNMTDLGDVIDHAVYCAETKGQTLVYCATIKNAEQMAQHLQGRSAALEVGLYHGELSDAHKKTGLDSFMQGTTKIMVATNAFGMGVDKPNIRAVIHRDIPGSPESVLQEIGRSGRDGLESECMMYYDPKSAGTQRWFIMNSFPDRRAIEKVFGALTMMKDAENHIFASQSDIALRADVHPMAVGGVIQALKAADVLESKRGNSKLSTVAFVGASEDEKFKQFRSAIHRCARPNDDNAYEFLLADVADVMTVKPGTVQSYLRGWKERGYVDFSPPARGSDITVKGDLRRVEFDRLERKAEIAYEKLEDVIKYVNTPDNQKHAFLEKCFGVKVDA